MRGGDAVVRGGVGWALLSGGPGERERERQRERERERERERKRERGRERKRERGGESMLIPIIPCFIQYF